MCGIAGWVDWGRDLSREDAVLGAMARTLACRGPDDDGLWLSPHAAFAHRRLAVIDLAGGKQPMVRASKAGRASVVTYAGEVYNHVELRDELCALGHRFETRSDTEVLLRAYLEWGPSVVDHLNGMFAFGLWDGDREELFLARDRLGIKPLFYAVRGRSLVFGSEPKALLAHPAIRSEIDDEGLSELFALGPMRSPGRGIFRGVDELRPGFVARFGQGGVRVSRYWQLESRPHGDDLDTTTRKVRSLLEDTVRRQLVSDVPICTLLSGGLDSSAVTALAARDLAAEGRSLDCYSVDFPGAEENFVASDIQPDLDAPWAEKVAEVTGARRQVVLADMRQILAEFFEPLRARDLPSFGELDVSLYLLFREIKRRHTVAVSGESADEVFGGYPWFFQNDAIEADTFPWFSHRLSAGEFLAPGLRERLRPEQYVDARYREALDEVPYLPGEKARDRRMREILYLNQTRFLPVLLDRKDRMSMAVGLEVRVPFCDHRLVEYVWNVPWEMKAFGGREKGLLRRALEGVLPDDVLWRKKSAYPSSHDPAYDDAVRRWLSAVLDDRDAPLRPLVDVPRLRASLASAPDASRGPFAHPVHAWAYLVQVNEWLRRYRVSIV